MVATHGTTGANGHGADTLESVNPATGEILGTVPVYGAEEVDEAVARAREAARRWAELGFGGRGKELTRFRRAIAERCDELAELIHEENGKPRVDALLEVMTSLVHIHHAGVRAEKALKPHKVATGLMANFRAEVSYLPLGVVGVIGPWNYPLFTPMGSIAYALAAGNAVVFKPSELTPLVGQRLAEIAAESISIPNVLQVVTGDGRTGGALARAALGKIAFTGSAATGRKVMAAAAERLTPVLMELGGKDPLVVAPDADIDKAAEAAVYGALANTGQACVSIERAYVVESVYDRFVDKVVEEAQQVRIGSDDDAHLGPMTRPQQIDIIREQLEDAVAKGAKVLVGGQDAVEGSFVEPTIVVDLSPEMRLMQEETFGPVLPIIKVANVDEAIARANESGFGLGSAVFGRKGVRALAARIRAGMTSINSVMAFAAIPSLPFGGVGESGFGRIHGDEGLREFCRAKATAEERFALPVALLSFKLPKNAYDRVRNTIKQLYGGGVVDRAGSVLRKITG